jgi:hypothetical protein
MLQGRLWELHKPICLLLAAEEHRRILGPERGEARVWRPISIPAKRAGRF